MAYDELTQAQLDRLTEGFKKRIAELEFFVKGSDEWIANLLPINEGFKKRIAELENTTSALDETLETAAAKIESLEEQLAAFEAFFEGRPVAHPHDPTPTPPAPTFSVRRSYTENQDPRPPFIEIGLRRG